MKQGVEGFQGSSLKAAREARQFTVVHLADSVGVSRNLIYQYENGETRPQADILVRLAQVLRQPTDFFTSKDPYSERKSDPFFRSQKGTTRMARLAACVRHKWLLRIVDQIEAYVELPAIQIPSWDLGADTRQMEDEEIEYLANETRKHWALGYGPIANLTWVAENAGAVISCHDFECNELDAYSDTTLSSRPVIAINSGKVTAARYRFDLAHELGHLILHRDLNRDLLQDDDAFDEIERQAHRFAGAFLIPKDSFLAEFRKLDLNFLLLGKQRWQVSVALIIKRAENLGVASRGEIERLWIAMSKRGW